MADKHESESGAAVAGAATGSAYPLGVDQDALQHGSLMPDLIRLDNDSKIKFCNAWHAMNRHYTVCAQCREYLINGDNDLCAIGKHLVAKELCYAECRVEFTPNAKLMDAAPEPSHSTGVTD